jgi:alpha-aminoadipate carrier protein LysW
MFDEPVRNRRGERGKMRARCPECQSWVNLKDSVEEWDLVRCDRCGTELEVVQLNPPMLDYVGEEWVDDAWEDDWDESDDH